MKNLKQDIVDQLMLSNEMQVSHLISNSFTVHKLLNNMAFQKPVTDFKIPKFLLGIKAVLNEVPKAQIMDKTIDLILLVLDQLDYEISREEAFVLYSLKDLGRFRMKDSKLFSDLESLYSTHPSYRLDKSDFKDVLKELKNVGLIELRRGAIMLSERLMIN